MQLIEARSDRHLWAETYDRSLDDVFAVQSEIAGQVASALQAKLTPQESAALKSVPTRSRKAYDLFLRAEHFARIARQNFSPATLPEALELYRQAVADDPRFALAYARLSFAESLQHWIGAAPPEGPPNQAQSNAEKAVALQPDLIEAHLALAYCDYWGRLDFASASRHLARAQALAPQNAEVLSVLAAVYRRQLRFDDAIAMFERAAEYDPGNSQLFNDLASTYAWAHRDDKVQPTFERALALDPENENAARQLAQYLIARRGDVEGARGLLRGRGPHLQTELARTYWLTRDYDEAIRLIEELPADSRAFGQTRYTKDELLGLYLHSAGQNERARPLLEQGRRRLRALLEDPTRDTRRVLFHAIRLARVELALGDPDTAVQVAERGARSDAVTRDAIQGPGYRRDLAKVYALTGRHDEAIALISELLKLNSAIVGTTPIMLRLDPDWDPIREDPRFQALLRPADGDQKAIKP